MTTAQIAPGDSDAKGILVIFQIQNLGLILVW